MYLGMETNCGESMFAHKMQLVCVGALIFFNDSEYSAKIFSDWLPFGCVTDFILFGEHSSEMT